MIHMSHDHDTRQASHFTGGTTLKSMCLSIRGPVMWNKLSTTVNMFNKCIKPFWFSEYATTSFIAEIAISNYSSTCLGRPPS